MKVSVVVPVRDEEATIRELLDSLLSQTRLPDEIVIVDGGSRDKTVEIVQQYARRQHRIRLVPTGGAFPGEGRNLGVQAATHEVIAFTDAGIRLAPRWLEKLCEPMERDGTADVVYGNLEPITETFFEECAALAYVPARSDHGCVRIRAPFIVSSLLRRSVIESVGGFPPLRASEDLIFMEAVGRGNFKIAYTPKAMAYWRLAPDWTTTFRRFATYSFHNLVAGRGAHWHLGVARIYLAASALLMLAFVHSRLWTAILIVGLFGRSLRILYRKRGAFAFRNHFHPRRVAWLVALLVWIDAATAWGALRWMLRGQPRIRAGGVPGGASWQVGEHEWMS